MPTHDRGAAADRATLAAVVDDAVGGVGTSGNGIGLELELFPVARSAPTRRLRLEEGVAGCPPTATVLDAAREDAVSTGATLTAEPGGQVEVATSCCQRLPDAIDQLDRVVARLAARFDAQGADLIATGSDVWHPLADVPQQLDQPRYRAMDAYLGRRHRDGRLMMRHTCALQVNLDLGTGQVREDRWAVTNLLAPLATAAFATSPAVVAGRRVRSRRALAWQALDPTRTGFTAAFLAGRGTLEEQVRELASHADVLLVRTPDGGSVPGTPGWRFGDWLDTGHPRYGWPTADDVREHLTTLFPEVRARGFVELRAVDAVPARYRTAVVSLLAGAVLDPRARDAVLGLLEPHRARLRDLARRCATDGLSDAALCALAVEVWSYARDGAARLPGVTDRHVGALDAFIDRFTVRGRCPGDDLADLLAVHPADALAWAAEPLPTTSEVSR